MHSPSEFRSTFGYKMQRIGKGAYGNVYTSSKPEFVIKQLDNMDLPEEIINQTYLGSDIPYVAGMCGWTMDNKIKIAYKAMTGDVSNSTLWYDMSVEGIKFFFTKVMIGLANIHSKNMAHLDIKFNNILYKSKIDFYPFNPIIDQIVITDFGTSVNGLYHIQNIEKGIKVVTSPYRPPEVFLGLPYGLPADIWSLGIMIIEAHMMVGGVQRYLYTEDNGYDMFNMFGLPTEEEWPQVTLSSEYKRFSNCPPVQKRTSVLVDLMKKHHMTTSCIDLVLGMLQMNPTKRTTIFEIIDHPYLSSTFNELATNVPKPTSWFTSIQNNVIITKQSSRINSYDRSLALQYFFKLNDELGYDYKIFAIAVMVGDAYMDQIENDTSILTIYCAAHFLTTSYRKKEIYESEYDNWAIPGLQQSKMEQVRINMLSNYSRIVSMSTIIDVIDLTCKTRNLDVFFTCHILNLGILAIMAGSYFDQDTIKFAETIISIGYDSHQHVELLNDMKQMLKHTEIVSKLNSTHKMQKTISFLIDPK